MPGYSLLKQVKQRNVTVPGAEAEAHPLTFLGGEGLSC